jgi:hypothetical protein
MRRSRERRQFFGGEQMTHGPDRRMLVTLQQGDATVHKLSPVAASQCSSGPPEHVSPLVATHSRGSTPSRRSRGTTHAPSSGRTRS